VESQIPKEKISALIIPTERESEATWLSSRTLLVFLMTSADAPFSEGDVDKLRSGDYVLYLYGKIDYRDAFSRLHHTTFCQYIMPDLKTVNHCDKGNNAD
jgi:hypothetical protein